GICLCRAMLNTGEPYKRFLANIQAQGGDVEGFEKGLGKLRAPIQKELVAPRSGWVQKIEAFKTGLAAVTLGAGRNKTTDSVYPYVGIVFYKKRGEVVQKGEPIAELYAEKETDAEKALVLLQEAVHLESGSPPRVSPPSSLILREIAAL
ncbi:MAG: thymidine phosphorylase, partial [Spirochaetales bacterium]